LLFFAEIYKNNSQFRLNFRCEKAIFLTETVLPAVSTSSRELVEGTP